jgi:hypothetical protein
MGLGLMRPVRGAEAIEKRVTSDLESEPEELDEVEEDAAAE